MTVEERRGIMGREGGSRDQFPVGMRVLAVDDDPVCLKLLEALLLKCHYHVTTTNGGISALEMLRRNKGSFDLVISDVHMPDMDGFTLLERVGLDMDLPVIMLSADGETEAVMKGIAHGACDYLLKPVRIEELRNIWQHVIRRKYDPRDHNNLDNGEDCEKPYHGNSEGGQGQVTSGSSDRNGRVNRKRKDQNEEEEDDCEENMHENEDTSTQKKPRVVWSIELHRKFVAAVNQLGLDKAVPKRILDLMNVERLTRENVASHLQKYRLYLKRLSAVANQQANMAAALGVRDPSYLPMASLDGFGDFHTLAASSQLPALLSFQPNGVRSKTNPNVLGFHGLSPGIVQVGRTHNTTSNPINDLSKIQGISVLGNQHGNLLPGIPTTLELDHQLQQHKRIQEAHNRLPSGISGGGQTTGSSSNSIVNATNSPLLLQARHSSVGIPSMNADPFDMGAGVSSQLPDLGRCNETWQSAVPLTGYAANTLPIGAPFSHDGLARSNTRSNVTPIDSQINSSPRNVSSRRGVVAPSTDPLIGRDVQCQASSLGGNMILMQRGTDKDSNYLNVRSIGNSQQKWGEPSQDHTREPNIMFSSSIHPPLSGQSIVDPTAHNQRLNNGIYNQRMDTNVIGQPNFSAAFPTQHWKIDQSITDGQLKYKDGYFLETSKLQGGLNSNGCSFDDLVNAMIKPEREDVIFMDG